MTNDYGYLTIQYWMREQLGLSGNELIIYSIIYGFSQDGESRYKGSRQYLADWCGCSLRNVHNILNNLITKELITKFDYVLNGQKMCEYVANFLPSEKISYLVKKFPIDNIDNNKYILNKSMDSFNTKENKKLDKETKKFIKPTIEEIKKYILSKNYQIDAEYFFNYYESKGWVVGKSPMKSWQAALSNWNKNNKKNNSYSRFGNTNYDDEEVI